MGATQKLATLADTSTPTSAVPSRRHWLVLLIIPIVICVVLLVNKEEPGSSPAPTTPPPQTTLQPPEPAYSTSLPPVVGTPMLLFVGDSITQLAANPATRGFQANLSYDYIRRADIANRGLSGWNTRGWRQVLPQLLNEWVAKPPRLVVLFLGANDAAVPGDYLEVPLDEYGANLAAMVAAMNATFLAPAFILVTPPAFDDASSWPRRNARTGIYAQRCQEVAANLSVPVLDLWTPWQGQQQTMLIDGLHLSPAGNDYVHSQLLALIRKDIPKLAPEALPIQF
ncbi:hypothetical protein ACHHYP_04573 [Achlya hypogyna]|uniref:SGNH hydrolase-type esterase domain-containing protein n=1 Tax=Achlya hypogyna TaxID=1202772 RepID=A0A1V9Z0J0_ACHHY|nr:hypothetical protein ACHHYP_04573 [Achlya hypogyna]